MRREPATNAAGQTIPTPRLHVSGRWLRDPNGTDVVLRGLNTVDPVWARRHSDLRGAAFLPSLKHVTARDRGWYPRVVRIPVEPRSLDVGLQTLIEDHLRPAVDVLGSRHCYVILDYHRIDRWDTRETDRSVRSFWETVAPAFAEDEHVLFELFNEPTEPFGAGQRDWDDWRETAQPWVNLVRAHAPETPIIVGSPRWSSYTQFAAANPFDGEDLLYASHLYPAHLDADDGAALRSVAQSRPVFVTEWGYIDVADKPAHMRGSTTDAGARFRSLLTDLPNVNWTAWCADSVWDPKMFDTDWNLRGGDHYMGAFTKQFLADRRDHHRPTTTLVEGPETFEDVAERSEDWSVASPTPDWCRWDGPFLTPTSDTAGLVYRLPHIRDVTVRMICRQPVDPAHVSLFALVDDVWSALPTTHSTLDSEADGHRIALAPANGVPDRLDGLRIDVGSDQNCSNGYVEGIEIDCATALARDQPTERDSAS